MARGNVVWFDIQKGFGFITDEAQGDDVFVHYSKIDGPEGEFKYLDAGELVEFERFEVDRGNGLKKPQAKNVKLVSRRETTKGDK